MVKAETVNLVKMLGYKSVGREKAVFVARRLKAVFIAVEYRGAASAVYTVKIVDAKVTYKLICVALRIAPTFPIPVIS